MGRKMEEWGILVKILFSDPRVEGEEKEKNSRYKHWNCITEASNLCNQSDSKHCLFNMKRGEFLQYCGREEGEEYWRSHQ